MTSKGKAPLGPTTTSLLSPYGSIPIALLVGPNKTTLYAHKDILNSNTNYWTLLLDDATPPGSQKSLNLPHDDPIVVSLFLDFIYSRKYTIPKTLEYPKPEIFLHVQLYFFGRKHLLPILQDYALSKIRRLLVKYHAAGGYGLTPELEFDHRLALIKQVYNRTSVKDELRKLLARDFAMRWESYRDDALVDGDIAGYSDLGRLLEAVPRFERDLLLYVGDSTVEPLPVADKVDPSAYARFIEEGGVDEEGDEGEDEEGDEEGGEEYDGNVDGGW